MTITISNLFVQLRHTSINYANYNMATTYTIPINILPQDTRAGVNNNRGFQTTPLTIKIFRLFSFVIFGCRPTATACRNQRCRENVIWGMCTFIYLLVLFQIKFKLLSFKRNLSGRTLIYEYIHHHHPIKVLATCLAIITVEPLATPSLSTLSVERDRSVSLGKPLILHVDLN